MPDRIPIEPFETDDGSLDGLSAAACFALGVEWEMFRQKLNQLQPFSALVHTRNALRVCRMAERHNRFVESHPVAPFYTAVIVGSSKSSVTDDNLDAA